MSGSRVGVPAAVTSYLTVRTAPLVLVKGPATQTHLLPCQSQVTAGSPGGRTIPNCWLLFVAFHATVSEFFAIFTFWSSTWMSTPGLTVTATAFCPMADY